MNLQYKLLIVCVMRTANPYCPDTPLITFATQQECTDFVAKQHFQLNPGMALVCQDTQASPMDKLRQAVDAVKDQFK